jgi:hypothetical protein
VHKKTVLLLTAALAIPAAGLLLGRALAARNLRRDAARLFGPVPTAPARIYQESQLVGLPAPVQRYFRHVLREGQPYLRGLRLRHTGQFKTDLKKEWLAIEGEQYITTDPPGFIWQGTTRWFTARDEFVAGRGSLTVRLLGALPVVHGRGPHFDQGELLRWLFESTWLPTALLPSEQLAWTAINDRSAQLTFTHQGQSVSCLARFNEQDELEECEALRYLDEATQRPWVGRFAHYRRWRGVFIPTVGEASWVVDRQRQPYARFVVQELEYEPLGPF